MPRDPVTNAATPIRLSISEAAKLFGVSTVTIRRAIKDGTLSYVVVRGRYQLSFDAVLKWSQSGTRTKNKLASDGMGRYVAQWNIANPLYSPSPRRLGRKVVQQRAHDKEDGDA